jgi:hypothetical protein
VKRFEITPNQFRVADFVGWQREGTLRLNPPFQRRSVWKPGARSYFIDTLARGLPVPLIFIRERVDLETQTVTRDIVDGQQRLRTVFAFVDEGLLPEFDPEKDRFTVRPEHNTELAGKSFKELDSETKNHILGYRFSVQILPPAIEDRDVLQIFARLNSTGIRLSPQELRNAAWFGEFKTRMYSLAYEQLERWLRWDVFSEDQISRMSEVELVSDLVVNMMQGLTGKSQRVLDRFYQQYDTKFPGAAEITRRFRRVMDAIDDLYGDRMRRSSFSRVMHFFTLFVYLYDRLYVLKSDLHRREPRSLPRGLGSRLGEVDRRFREGDLPADVLEAVSGAATDLGRRKTRLKFLASICDGKAR